MSNIKAFVICLEKKIKQRCDVNFESYKKLFNDVNKFTAVDADKIDINDTNIVHPFAQMTIQNKLGDDVFFIQGKGTIGCSLSHIELWKKCVALNEPIVVIEDDMKFTDKISKKINKSLENLPDDTDFAGLMYIPVSTSKNFTKYNQRWNKIIGPNYAGLQCYYITPRGASILLKNSLPITTHVDQWVGINADLYKDFKAYMLKEKLYTITKFIKDDINSALNHDSYSLKRLLPNYNWFYILILCVIVSLVTVFIVKRKQCFRK